MRKETLNDIVNGSHKYVWSHYRRTYNFITGHPRWNEKDGTFQRVWMHLIHELAYEGGFETDFGGKTIIIKRGQLKTGIFEISQKLRLNPNKIRRALERMQSDKLIHIQTCNLGSLITVICVYVGWEHDKPNDKQTTNKRQTNDKQTTTIYKENNVNKENKVNKENNIKSVKSVDLPPEFERYAEKFYKEYIQIHYPRSTTNLMGCKKSVKALLRKSYNNLGEYYLILEFLQSDTRNGSFWRTQIQSLAKLDKIKDEVRYFDKMLMMARSDKSTSNNYSNSKKLQHAEDAGREMQANSDANELRKKEFSNELPEGWI